VGNVIVPWEEKKGLNYSLWQLKLLLPKDMIIPQGKKGLNCSLGQYKLLLLNNMIVPQGKMQFLQGTINLPSRNICSESFCNDNHFRFICI